jgi:hypothetical protein
VATEKDFETVIAKYPELIEDGLHLVGRQLFVQGRKLDLLFEDRRKNQLVAELKWGPIKDQDIGQVMSYAGCLISGRPTREILVGTRVPPNIRTILDYHGIAWKQIAASELREFLRARGDDELAKVFDDDIGAASADAQPLNSLQPLAALGPAALFAPVNGKYLDMAHEHFVRKDVLYFSTNAPIRRAAELDIHHVYFKKTGENAVAARGDFKELTDIAPPPDERLPGSVSEKSRFYYGFRNLRQIDPIPLSNLRYYATDTALRNDVMGACIIKEPDVPLTAPAVVP